MVKWSRRQFLKATGAGAGALWALELGFDLTAAEARAHELKTAQAKEIPTICPLCAVGCAVIASVRDGQVVNVEGNPDSFINAGSLCAKGAALLQAAVNPRRLTKVKYRAPFSDHWEEKDWNWALREIAERVKETRDATFTRALPDGTPVNRTEGIGHLGSAMVTNEEAYLIVKLMRSLGLVWIDHQARI